MNVRPKTYSGKRPSLVGAEGELESVSIAADPRFLERLLETLAELPFPVNPQIRHSAAQPVATVEFPAYASRLEEIRRAVAARGFDPASVTVKSMLEQIREGSGRVRPSPTECG